ncbi:MAG: type II secretion system major pseudopilin GspG [Verrucomicrobia bacterium]|jgi:general secretion pathway protein G|nr:type II secretion system major pseudopilin GspG [Verrucomicrobiota bacterium]
MNKRAGFTLLELLVVILIITILGAVVGVKLAGKPDEARRAAAVAQIENCRLALKLYRMDNGVLPTQRQGLQALVEASPLDPKPARFPKEGYLERRTLPLDPWGNDYVYLIPGSRGEAYEVICYGRDGEPGGLDEDADISSVDL